MPPVCSQACAPTSPQSTNQPLLPLPSPQPPNPTPPPIPPPQAQLQLFCAAYLGVHAREVLLMQADRLGFTLLGAPAQQAQQAQQRWRQFRIGSARELRGPRQFQELLQQMRAEVTDAAGAA